MEINSKDKLEIDKIKGLLDYQNLTESQKIMMNNINEKNYIITGQPGTGKTFTYILKIIDVLNKCKNSKILIISATRELAFQLKNNYFDKIDNNLSQLIIPNEKIKKIKGRILIGTIGKLNYLLNKKKIEFKLIVLDEFDKLTNGKDVTTSSLLNGVKSSTK